MNRSNEGHIGRNDISRDHPVPDLKRKAHNDTSSPTTDHAPPSKRQTLALSSSSSMFVDQVLLTRISSPMSQDRDVHLLDFLSDMNPDLKGTRCGLERDTKS